MFLAETNLYCQRVSRAKKRGWRGWTDAPGFVRAKNYSWLMCRERNQELTQETIRVWDLVYDVIVSWSVIEEEWMSSQGALRLCFLQDGGVFLRTSCFYGVFVWHFYRVRILSRGKQDYSYILCLFIFSKKETLLEYFFWNVYFFVFELWYPDLSSLPVQE